MSFIFKRLAMAIPLLLLTTCLSFCLMKLAPGDPSMIYLDPQASAQDMAQVRQNLGLDQPLLIQYGHWLIQTMQGHLGYSHITGQSVSEAISQRLGPTLILSISSLTLILIITFPLGLLSAAKQNSWLDHSITFFSFLGMAIPTFWLGLTFILIFSLKLNLFPTSGYLDPMLLNASLFSKTQNIIYHLILPLSTIVVGSIAGLTRYYRFGVIQILNQDYIKAARARGITDYTLLTKHAFKNAALPIVTLLGLSLPGLIGGSFVIEYIFAWPGLGQLGLQAVFARDYPVLMGTLLFSSILIIIGNLLADISYHLIDPRIRRPSQ